MHCAPYGGILQNYSPLETMPLGEIISVKWRPMQYAKNVFCWIHLESEAYRGTVEIWVKYYVSVQLGGNMLCA